MIGLFVATQFSVIHQRLQDMLSRRVVESLVKYSCIHGAGLEDMYSC